MIWLLVVMTLGVGLAQVEGIPAPREPTPVEARCGTHGGRNYEEAWAYQACAAAVLSGQLHNLQHGLVWGEVIPYLGLLLVAGIGWRIGAGW